LENILQEVSICENMTDYFEVYDSQKAKMFIKSLYDRNSHRLRSNWLDRMFVCLNSGVDRDTVHFAICEASVFKVLLKKMVSTPLMPFAGNNAVSGFITRLNEEKNALHTGGYYDPNNNLLFVVVENPLMEITDDGFFDILIHEMCHYFAANHAREFRVLFKEKYLVPFYTHLFKELQYAVRNEHNEKTAATMGRAFAYHMLSLERFFTNQQVSHSRMMKYVDRTYERLSDLDMEVAKLWYYLLLDAFELHKHKELDHAILSNCYNAIGVPSSELFLYYQELLIPSEVVAISSAFNKKQSEYTRMLNEIW